MKFQHTNKSEKRVKHITHIMHTALSMLLILVLCFSSLGMALPPDGDASENGEITNGAERDGGSDFSDETNDSSLAAPAQSNNVSGMVWIDANEDGVVDSGENILSGFFVSLYLEEDLTGVLDTAETGKDGTYEFTDIAPGSYVLGIKAQEIGGIEYLLPLTGYTDDNQFQVAGDWVNAYTKAIDIQADSDIKGLDTGVRVPPDIQPMSFTSGAMVLTGVTAGDLQAMVEDDLVVNAGQTAGSYDYTVITSLTISGALNVVDTMFIWSNLTNLATLDMSGVTTTTFPTNAFPSYTSLVSVTLPAGCAVSEFMFYNCTNLTTVNNLDKAASFGQYAFIGCTSLVSVTLPIGCAGV